jgi:hypothetical protein
MRQRCVVRCSVSTLAYSSSDGAAGFPATSQVASTTPISAGQGSSSTPKLSAGEKRAATETLQALKALESVTEAGVTYQEYLRRLGDAKIVVNRASEGIKEPELKSSITTTMLYYEQIGSVWNAKIQKYDLADYFRSAAADCPAAKELIDKDRSEKYPGIWLNVSGVQTMMGCASQKLSDLSQRFDAMK